MPRPRRSTYAGILAPSIGFLALVGCTADVGSLNEDQTIDEGNGEQVPPTASAPGETDSPPREGVRRPPGDRLKGLPFGTRSVIYDANKLVVRCPPAPAACVIKNMSGADISFDAYGFMGSRAAFTGSGTPLGNGFLTVSRIAPVSTPAGSLPAQSAWAELKATGVRTVVANETIPIGRPLNSAMAVRFLFTSGAVVYEGPIHFDPVAPGSYTPVASCTALQNMVAGGRYELTQNITCSGEFTPINLGTSDFELKGNSRQISNLTITRPTEFNVGLFRGLYSGAFYIHDITFVNANVTGKTGAGVLAGGYGTAGPSQAIIENVTVSGGTVTATDSHAGGLVGFASVDRIKNCSSSATVTTTTGWAGGLIGDLGWGRVIGSSATGIVRSTGTDPNYTQGAYGTGGLVGQLDRGVISQSWASGAVTGFNGVGGLVGYAPSEYASSFLPLVQNSYATGAVSASRSGGAGGLLGRGGGYFTTGGGVVTDIGGLDIRDSYATGDVSSTQSYAGAIVGLLGGVGVGGLRNAFGTGHVTAASAAGCAMGSNSISNVPFVRSSVVQDIRCLNWVTGPDNATQCYGASTSGSECAMIAEANINYFRGTTVTTNIPMSSWKFSAPNQIWNAVTGYPALLPVP